MKPITNLKSQTPAAYARQAASLIKQNLCDRRAFDDCFEMGNAPDVIRALLGLHDNDESLQTACNRNRRYIDIERWRAEYRPAAEGV
jgi:hypothetical protein